MKKVTKEELVKLLETSNFYKNRVALNQIINIYGKTTEERTEIDIQTTLDYKEYYKAHNAYLEALDKYCTQS